MKTSDLMAISFGCTLALVVGLRLNMAGLLLVATVLLSALLLCPLFALRVAITGVVEWAPEVRVERDGESNLDGGQAKRLALPHDEAGRARRGGWPHLATNWGHQKGEHPLLRSHYIQGGQHVGSTMDG